MAAAPLERGLSSTSADSPSPRPSVHAGSIHGCVHVQLVGAFVPAALADSWVKVGEAQVQVDLVNKAGKPIHFATVRAKRCALRVARNATVRAFMHVPLEWQLCNACGACARAGAQRAAASAAA